MREICMKEIQTAEQLNVKGSIWFTFKLDQ